MDQQTVCRNAHGQDVIGYPLVKQMLGRIVAYTGGLEHVIFRILTILQNPLREFFQQIGAVGIQSLRAPIVVRLCKDGETNQSVRRRVGISSLVYTRIHKTQ